MSRHDQRIITGVAVVTGAGSGLGRALSQGLAAKGMRVAALGRRLDALNETAKASALITPLQCDVANSENLARAFLTVTHEIDPITLLINNAAVYPRRDIFDETQDSFMETMAINLGGVLGASRLALDSMAKTGVGRILNIASFADIAPLPASSAYSVSKGAARILTRALIADISDRFPDIVVSDWLPGMLATDMGIPNGLNPETAAQWGVELALWHDRSLNGTLFEMNKELPPPLSLKARVKNRLLLRKTPPIRTL